MSNTEHYEVFPQKWLDRRQFHCLHRHYDWTLPTFMKWVKKDSRKKRMSGRGDGLQSEPTPLIHRDGSDFVEERKALTEDDLAKSFMIYNHFLAYTKKLEWFALEVVKYKALYIAYSSLEMDGINFELLKKSLSSTSDSSNIASAKQIAGIERIGDVLAHMIDMEYLRSHPNEFEKICKDFGSPNQLSRGGSGAILFDGHFKGFINFHSAFRIPYNYDELLREDVK